MRPKSKLHQPVDPDMREAYSNLFFALEQASGAAPAALLKAVKQLPEQVNLPPLTDAWQLIKFAANAERRSWGEAALACLLPHEPVFLAAIEKRRHMQGRVPSDPDWQFDIDDGDEEIVCAIRHRTTGEEIDFIIPGNPRHEDELSGITPGSLPWQLKNLHLGGFAGEDDAIAVWLSHQFRCYEAAIQSFHQRWQDDNQRLWLAALVGDWPHAHAAALLCGHKPLIAETQRRAKEWFAPQNFLRMDNFFCPWRSWDRRWAVRVLANHRVRYLHDAMKASFLTKPIAVPAALELILEEDLPGWENEVHSWFLARDCCVRQDLAANAAVYLAKRDVSTLKVIEMLHSRTCSGADRWELLSAVLTTRCDARLGKSIFQQGLRSDSDQTAILAMAAMAVSDWPWANGLLKRAQHDLESPLAKAACRLALRRHNGKKTRVVGVRRKKGAQEWLLVNRGVDCHPLHYLGTVEDLFEEATEEVLQCKATLERRLGDKATADE